MNSLVLIGSGSLVCLMPLAIYLLFLAFLNQRSHPTIMSGAWDFACVLMGLSGFILIGGPLLISVLDSRGRGQLFGARPNHWRAAWESHAAFWSGIAAAYVLVVIGGVLLLLRQRRQVTVIYNFDPAFLDETLVAALESLGLGWRRVVGGFAIGRRGRPEKLAQHSAASESSTPGRLPLSIGHEAAFVHFDSFRSLRHAVLHWRDYDSQLRREVEGELERILLVSESPANPAAGWFMTAAVSLFFIMLLWMAFLVYCLVRL